MLYYQGIGKKDSQEDFFVLEKINIKNKKDAFLFLYEYTSELISATKNMYAGSTMSIALLTPDGYVTVANMGDSPIYAYNYMWHHDIVELHQEHNVIYAHKNELDFAEKIKKIRVMHGGVTHSLGMEIGCGSTRILGRNKIESVINYEPFIQSYDMNEMVYKRKENEYCNKPYSHIIVCSDGWTEYEDPWKDKRSKIIDVFINNIKKTNSMNGLKELLPSEEILKMFQKEMEMRVQNKLQTDNHTFLVSDFSHAPLFMAVFDGHLGEEVSKFSKEFTVNYLKKYKTKGE